MFFIIGSGPAAIATAHALVSQGREVTILDVGTRLSRDREEILGRMSAGNPEDWTPEDLAAIDGDHEVSEQAIHSKTTYGSAFSFDSRNNAIGIRWEKSRGFNHSLARGGLSNVWGSALLPYRQADINDWPIRLAELEPHYRAVMNFVPGTSVVDDLEKILPSYSTQQNILEPSRQGKALLNDLDEYRDILQEAGIFHGRSRLALRATGWDGSRDCARCCLCLSGCPYGLIYSSAQTLRELQKSEKFAYIDDHLVEKMEMENNEVIITGKMLSTGIPFRFKGERAFLGAGVLSTAKVVLNSLTAYDMPVRLLDSQYFIYPLLRLAGVGDVEQERMHTASQVFLELEDPAVSDHLVHLQVYGYSSFLHRELNRTFLRWPLRADWFRQQFLSRLLVAQGFMHSRDSDWVELVLRKDRVGSDYLSARPMRSNRPFATALKVGFKLLQHMDHLKAIPLLPGMQFPEPGSGYHSGGTFPMRAQPGAMETDTLGRLPSMDRVHLVDASVFPSIPATSITMSIMANAHRIGTWAASN